ncbi:hypothetical protein GQ600_26931 [Phytophthora cactorum]|nr:hypothetical protein GQ600_26931 [Phytophthora cactorum]
MKKFQSVIKKLQYDAIDLADVRLLFDSVVEEYPCMRDQLKPKRQDCASPVFHRVANDAVDVDQISSSQAIQAVNNLSVKRFVRLPPRAVSPA